MRRKLRQAVVDDERVAAAEGGDSKRAEVRQPVMAERMGRARSRPIAADREAVLVVIHVGISAVRDGEILADHAGGDCENVVRVEACCCPFAERVEEVQPSVIFAKFCC